jgi:hypothetical protein
VFAGLDNAVVVENVCQFLDPHELMRLEDALAKKATALKIKDSLTIAEKEQVDQGIF